MCYFRGKMVKKDKNMEGDDNFMEIKWKESVDD